MDNKIAQYIVDILRRKQETAALNQGGMMQPPPVRPPPGIGGMLPRGVEPKHGGKPYEELIDSYGAGR